MKKQKYTKTFMIAFAQKFLACTLFALFVVFQCNFFSLGGGTIYNFDTATELSSTQITSYAVTDDGTFLQRVVFKGVVKDFIMQFIGADVVLIPLMEDRFEQGKVVESFALLSVVQAAFRVVAEFKEIWGGQYVLMLFGVLGILTLEIQKLLLAFAQSRKGKVLFFVHTT